MTEHFTRSETLKHSIEVFINVLVCFLLGISPIQADEVEKSIQLNSDENKWLANHVVTIGVEKWHPIVFSNNGKDIDGLAGDYIKIISQKTGLQYVVMSGDWSELIQKFKKGEVDIIPDTYYTKGRETFGLFTNPYFKIKETLYVKSDNSDIRSFNDLAGKRLAIVKGYATIEKVQDTFPSIKIVETKDLDDSINRVLSGEVEALYEGQIQVDYKIQEEFVTGLKLVPQYIFKAPDLHMFVNKDKPILHQVLQKALDSIGEIEKNKISKKWISFETDKQSEYKLLLALLLLFIILLGGLLYWNRRLHSEAWLKKIAEDFMRSDGYFRSIHDNSLYGIGTTLGLDFKFSNVNDAFCKLTEYEKHELVGVRSIVDITVPDDYPQNKELLLKLTNNEIQQFRFEKRFLTKSGKHVDVVVYVLGFYDENGKYIGSTASVMDITKHKQMELELLAHKENLEELVAQRTSELKKSTRQLEIIIDNLPAIFFTKDIEGRFTLVNTHLEKAVGFSKEEVLGKTDAELFRDSSADELISHDKEILAKKEVFTFHEHAPHPDGTTHYYLTTKVPLLDEDGRPYSLIGMATDITEQKKVQQELETAKVRAEHATKAKSEFLANMSHEIRTPLNAITGFIQLMLKTELTKQQKEYLDKTINSADALQSLLSDILDFSKIEAGKLNIEHKAFDVQRLFENTLQIFDPVVKKKGLSLTYEIDSNLPKYLVGDSNRIGQILINLIGNAVKFTDEGSIHVELILLRQTGEKCIVECTVTDTGIGIAQEDQASLFDIFTQVDNSMIRKKGGSGLGLAICKKLIEIMGGTINLESEVGNGSTFSFELELDTTEETLAEVVQHSSKNIEFKELRVLVAEDNIDNREIICSLLQLMGVSVDEVENGKQALNMIQENKYDMVFMDIQMPVMDGLSTMKKLKEDGVEIPVVAFSAHTSKEERQRSLDAGMVEHLNKPFKFKEVSELLTRLFPTKVCYLEEENATLLAPWIDDLEPLPGIELDSQMCHYWDSKEEYFRHLKKFVVSLQKDSETLIGAIEGKNTTNAEELLHKLKGSAKFCGAIKLYKSIQALEKKFDQIEDASIISTMLEEYKKSVSELVKTVANR